MGLGQLVFTGHLEHESGWGDGGGPCEELGGQRSQSAWRGVVYWTQSRSPRLRSGRKKGRLGENHRLVMQHTSVSKQQSIGLLFHSVVIYAKKTNYVGSVPDVNKFISTNMPLCTTC